MNTLTNNNKKKWKFSMSLQDVNTNVIHAVNTSAVAATAASVLGWIPPFLAALASLFTILWMALQIYESKTFRRIAQHRVMCWIKSGFRR